MCDDIENFEKKVTVLSKQIIKTFLNKEKGVIYESMINTLESLFICETDFECRLMLIQDLIGLSQYLKSKLSKKEQENVK